MTTVQPHFKESCQQYTKVNIYKINIKNINKDKLSILSCFVLFIIHLCYIYRHINIKSLVGGDTVKLHTGVGWIGVMAI